MSDFESRLKAALHDETADLAAAPTLADDTVARGARVRRRRRMVAYSCALVVVAAVVPIWKGLETTSPPTSVASQPPTTAPVTAPPTSAVTTQKEPWPTRPMTVVLSPRRPPVVDDIRVGAHPAYDRLVIDLSGAMTGYHISYVSKLVSGGQGTPIDLQGKAFLSIQLTPATAHDNAGQTTFTGATTQRFDLPVLKGVHLEDFEGVTFGVALSKRAGYHVLALSSPTRLVIDFQH